MGVPLFSYVHYWHSISKWNDVQQLYVLAIIKFTRCWKKKERLVVGLYFLVFRLNEMTAFDRVDKITFLDKRSAMQPNFVNCSKGSLGLQDKWERTAHLGVGFRSE